MKDFIDEFIEDLIGTYKKTNFNIDTIKTCLIVKHNKKSLMYRGIAKNWLRQLFDLIQSLGYGRYDIVNMELKLNEDHPNVALWVAKYNIYEDNKIPKAKPDEEIDNPNKLDELFG